ncbi:unnamed protein product [Paramecium sonneborni]|uniref:Transmembrane protein n=1 Tax=Paramecium sonneborni TaxID=65129 RepID=A0A8S1QAH8_9CILI|nr:unnamed protein product [Paramecium sonneborni]
MIIYFLITYLGISNLIQTNLEYNCEQDITLKLQENYIPIILDKKAPQEFTLRDQPEFLKISGTFEIDSQNVVYSSIYDETLVQILYYNNLYYLKKFIMVFNLVQGQIMNYTLQIIYQAEIEIKQCEKILSVELATQKLFMLCQKDDQYFISIYDLRNNDQVLIPINSFTKQQQLSITQIIYIENQQYFLIGFYNCEDWIIFFCDYRAIQILARQNQFQDQILRHIQYDQDVILQFDHFIFNLDQNITIYENKEKKILNFLFQNNELVIILDKTDEYLVDQFQTHYILYRNDSPQIIIKEKPFIIMQFDTYIEYINKFSKSFLLFLKVQKLFFLDSYKPFLISINQFNELTLIQLNQHSQQLICNEYKYQNKINLASIIFKDNLILENIKIYHNRTYEISNFLYDEKIKLYKNSFQYSFFKLEIYNQRLAPEIILLQNNTIQCKIESFFIINGSCKVLKNLFWIKESITFNQLYILFQQNNYELWIMNCRTKQNFKVGKFERLDENKIQIFKFDIFIPYQEGTKILFIKIKQASFDSKIILIKDIVLKIFKSKLNYLIVTKSCLIYCLITSSRILFVEIYQDLTLHYENKCQNYNVLHNLVTSLFFNKTIKFISQRFTFEYDFDNEIISIHYIKLSQNNYIVIEKTKDQEIKLKKYIIDHYQKILLFLLPKYGFEYQIPIQYDENGYFLGIAATKNNTKVILIYYLFNDYHDILIDVIQVENFIFQFISDYQLAFQVNTKWSIYQLAKFTMNCQIETFTEEQKIEQYQLIFQSKLDEKIKNKITINFQFINLTGYLIPNKQSLIKFIVTSQNQIFFDPRNLVTGQIYSISSSDIDINPPIKNIRNISETLCSYQIDTVCYNYEENYFILDILNDENHRQIQAQDQQIFKSSSYYIIISFISKDQHQVQIYKQGLGIILTTNLKLENFLKFNWVYIFSNYFLIQFKQQLNIYVFESEILKLIETLNFDCYQCEIVEVQNLNNTIMMILLINQKIYIKILEIVNEKPNLHYFNDVEQSELLKSIQSRSYMFYNLISIHDKQLSCQLAVIPFDDNIQIYYVLLDLRFQQLRISKIGAISQFEINNIYQYFFLQSELMLLCIQSQIHKAIILYNLSNISAFNLQHPIQRVIVDQNSEIQLYNQTNFYIFQKGSNQSQLFELSKYSFEIKNTSNKLVNISFSNIQNNLELQIELIYKISDDSENNQLIFISDKFTFFFIFICFIIFLVIFYIIKHKKNKNQTLQNTIEIEL